MANARQMKELSMAEIRAILADEIHQNRAGKRTPSNVNAVNSAMGTILRSAKLQMDYSRQTGQTPHVPLLSSGTEEQPTP